MYHYSSEFEPRSFRLSFLFFPLAQKFIVVPCLLSTFSVWVSNWQEMFPSAMVGIGESLRRNLRRRASRIQHASFTSLPCKSTDGSLDTREECSTDSEIDDTDVVPVEATGCRDKVIVDVIHARDEMIDHFQAARLQMMHQHIRRMAETRTNLSACAESYTKALDPVFCHSLLSALRHIQARIEIIFKVTFHGICLRSRQAEYAFKNARTLNEIERVLFNFERHANSLRRRERRLIRESLVELSGRLETLPLKIGDKQWERLIGSLYFVDNGGRYRPGAPIRLRQDIPTSPASAPRLSLSFGASAQPHFGPSQNNSDGYDEANDFLIELSAAITRRVQSLPLSDQTHRSEMMEWFRSQVVAQVADLLGVNSGEHECRPECTANLPLRPRTLSADQVQEEQD